MEGWFLSIAGVPTLCQSTIGSVVHFHKPAHEAVTLEDVQEENHKEDSSTWK